MPCAVLGTGKSAECLKPTSALWEWKPCQALPFQTAQPLLPSPQCDQCQPQWLSTKTTQGAQPRGTRVSSTGFCSQRGDYGDIYPINIHTAPVPPFTSCYSQPDKDFAPGHGFGTLQTLRIRFCICLAARGQNKLQPRALCNGAEELSPAG